MYVTWQNVITAGAVITALTVIITLFLKVVRFIDRQKAQDEELARIKAGQSEEIKELRSLHDRDMEQLKAAERTEINAIKNEQTLLVYGVLACLKGLREQGCNGPVTEAINTIEKHLNQKAHE